MTSAFPADMRLLLAHKQKTSARVRFLRFPHGLCAFAALPALSSVLEEAPASRVETHPGLYLRGAEVNVGHAEADPTQDIYLVRFETGPDGNLAAPTKS